MQPINATTPRRSVDVRGRAIPMTEEEIRQWAEEVARGLDALDEMGDEEEQRQTLDALMAAVEGIPDTPDGDLDLQQVAQ